MTTTAMPSNDRLHQLEEIIRKATEEKQSLYDTELEALLDQIEARCELLGLSLKQLIAIANKRKRKSRAHRENGPPTPAQTRRWQCRWRLARKRCRRTASDAETLRLPVLG